jgi:hypothetical protein
MTSNRAASLVALTLALALAPSARADPTQPSAAPAPAAARSDPAAAAQGAGETVRPARVRASHQVDVIAPGEKVETVIDRMRTSAAVSTSAVDRSAAGAAAPSVRTPGGGAAERSGLPPPGAPGASPRTRLEAAPHEHPEHPPAR